PEYSISITNKGRVVSQAAIHFDHFSPRKLERRMSKPRSGDSHRFFIDGRGHTDKNILRQALTRTNHGVVSDKWFRTERSSRERNRATMDARPAQIDSIGEKAFGSDLDQLGNDVDDCADLAIATDLHSGKTQPHRPEQSSAQPIARGPDHSRLQQD